MKTNSIRNKTQHIHPANQFIKPTLLALTVMPAMALVVPVNALATEKTNSELIVTGRTQASTVNTYNADHSTAATGMALPLRETPQSVSVITQQRIKDQGLETLDDMMNNTTGVTFEQLDNSGRITYRARGFTISNYKTDGLTTNYNNGGNGHGTTVNMDLYDHVEIVRGANGLTGGTGDPSASVNFVRKAPAKQAGANLGLIYGRWDQRRMYADLNAPLAYDGRLSSRFVISGEDSGSWRDRAGTKNLDALASFLLDLPSGTMINIGAQYDRNRINGTSWGSNVPVWYADGSRTSLPRSTNPVPDWAHSATDSKTFFGSIEQYFADDWKTKLSASHNISNITYARSVAKVNSSNRSNRKNYWSGFWNQDGTGAILNAEYSDYSTKEDNIEWTINGVFHLFGRSHELMGGINGYRIEGTQYSFDQNKLNNCSIGDYKVFAMCQYRAQSDGIKIADWRTWDGTGVPAFNVHRTQAHSVTTITNYGGYLAGRFSLADPLSAIIGVRLSNYKTWKDTYDINNHKTSNPASSNNGVVTPYAGVVFDINDNHSLYASYTSIFNPQIGKHDTEGKQIRPITGNSYEAGLKSEFFDGRLSTSTVLFAAQQQNVAKKLENGVYTPQGNDAYSASARGIRSKGVEFDIAGALSENWNLYFGYTYLNVNDPNPGADMLDPRHVMRLFTTYQLPGVLHNLTMGGGVRAQSYTTKLARQPGRPKHLIVAGETGAHSREFDKVTLTNGGYALIDLMARYKFNDNVWLTVNIKNLFDKTYYRNIGFYNGLIYGEPRAYWATLNISY